MRHPIQLHTTVFNNILYKMSFKTQQTISLYPEHTTLLAAQEKNFTISQTFH
jgi:hypothetical protein